MKLKEYIGETTTYDKKLMLERSDPISWLKSVSAFANTHGGKLLFGVSDSGELMGLETAEKDAEDVSEIVKTQMDPIPQMKLSIHEENGKRFVIVEVYAGEETPYYVRHKSNLTAYVRIGNESVRADSLELNRLVLKGSRRSWDSLPSAYKRRDYSFEVLYSLYHEKTLHSFEESDFQSFGLIAGDGRLTNAGALFADRSPVRHSRVFCTRWNGLDKAHGVQDARDDATETTTETTIETTIENVALRLGENAAITYRLIVANNRITAAEIAGKLGLSVDGARYQLKKLKNANLVKFVGNPKSGHWAVEVKGT